MANVELTSPGADATALRAALLADSGSRNVLTANTTYHVATTGNDTTGDGSVGAPWATPQHALDWLNANIDGGGFGVRINQADGNYGGPTIAALPPNCAWVVFVGNTSDKTAVTWDDSGSAGSSVGACCEYAPSNFGVCQLSSITYTPSSGNSGVESDAIGSWLIFHNCKWKAPLGGTTGNGLNLFTSYAYNVFGVDVAGVGGSNTNEVEGEWGYFILLDQFFCMLQMFGTLTMVNTPNWTSAFAFVGEEFALLEVRHVALSGAATGSRFELRPNSSISTFTNDLTHLPGNAAGTFAAGSKYDSIQIISPPASDPHVAGAIWNNSGTLAISAG